MTVTKVEGSQVNGRIERGGSTAAATDFVGTLKQEKLTIVDPSGQTELTITGTRMRGRTFGADRFDIALIKR